MGRPAKVRRKAVERPRGSVDALPSGRYRAVIRAGRDQITGRYLKLTETHETEDEAWRAVERLNAQVDAERIPDRSGTVSVLLDRWMEVADHELSTRETTEGYVRRTLRPALGDLTVRKLQHRVDLLDRLYTHLRRCNVLCDGRPFVEHRASAPHDCAAAKCAPHRCKPMAASSVRRIHAILSSALGYGVAWGWIEKNPADYAHPPKLARRRALPPAAEQVAHLLNDAWAASIELGMFLWLATTTGARRGELVALRWDAVDLNRGFVDIAWKLCGAGGGAALEVDEDGRRSPAVPRRPDGPDVDGLQGAATGGLGAMPPRLS